MVSGQNIMTLSNATVFRGDTVTVELKITNSQPFVAFQTDIQFPAALTPVAGSGVLTERNNGHAFTYQVIAPNAVRLIAFSLNQNTFSGDSGAVARFRVLAGNQTGTYTMEIVSPVISNANSQNILTGSSNGYITIIDSVVKVELISFSAEQSENNQILLTWETSTEENALRFHIERITESAEMCRSFAVDASGTSTIPRSYSLTDDASGVSGAILYRLWEEDAKGSRTLLGEKEISMTFSEKGLALFQNHPNPFTSETTIKFYSDHTDPVNLVITNISGEEVKSVKLQNISRGYNIYKWNRRDDSGNKLPAGIYLFILRNTRFIDAVKTISYE